MEILKTILETKINLNFILFRAPQTSIFGFTGFANDAFFAILQSVWVTVALNIIIYFILLRFDNQTGKYFCYFVIYCMNYTH